MAAKTRPESAGHLAPTLVVALTGDGLSIPGLAGLPPIPLQLDALLLLSQLAGDGVTAPMDVVGGSADPPAGFVSELRARALLLPGDAPKSVDEPAPPRRDGGVAPAGTDTVLMATPTLLRVSARGYQFVDHDGRAVFSLDPRELWAVSELVRPVTLDAAFEAHGSRAGSEALSRTEFDALVGCLLDVDLLHRFTIDEFSASPEAVGDFQLRQSVVSYWKLTKLIDDQARERAVAEAEREVRTGTVRSPVFPVTFNGLTPPLALGLIYTYAMAYESGRLEEHYDFRPQWIIAKDKVAELVERPGVWLFSNYVWSLRECLEVSAQVKALSPTSITIHGGPSTPKYEVDAHEFFRRHPDVDIIVRGEGEATTADVLDRLAGLVGSDPLDLSVLHEVPGLYFRDGDRIVRTEDRDRMADLDVIPSPFLEGLFDVYGEVGGVNTTIETNRGCPYGCTFCDWGSATLSRIRKFDLDRVLGEIEWCARHGVLGIGPSDANFGIFERDVTIAEKAAEMRRLYGYPHVFGANYAKNSVKHLQKIIRTLVDADIMSAGILSLQSMDAATLEAIDRSNIKLEKYEELATAFREARLPLFVDLMVGLPGQTVATFHNDLQECIDREVHVRIPVTELLVNSPMNAADYRERFEIQVEPMIDERSLVVSTSTFTRADYANMMDLRRVFLLCENFGVFRQVGRFVRQEAGVREIDFYDRLRREVLDHPERWPAIALTLQVTPNLMVPPVSWQHLIDEIGDYLIGEIGLADDDALRTVLAVQHALLPSRGRSFPLVLELPHDYAAWHASMMAVKGTAERPAWPAHVPPLRSFGPGTLEIDDPMRTATLALGIELELHGFGANWEMVSPLARPLSIGEAVISRASGTLERAV